jgi:hypothetical protein
MTCHGQWNDITHCTEVVLTLGCVREANIRDRILGKTINATRTPRDLGTAHFLRGDELPILRNICAVTDLDSSNTTEGPEITVTNPFKLLLDLFH